MLFLCCLTSHVALFHLIMKCIDFNNECKNCVCDDHINNSVAIVCSGSMLSQCPTYVTWSICPTCLLCVSSRLCALFSSHGRSVQLCCAHGQAERTDLWGGRASNRHQVYEGCPAVPGASHGQEKGGVWLVPTAQDILRHDPEAQVHGIVQVL